MYYDGFLIVCSRKIYYIIAYHESIECCAPRGAPLPRIECHIVAQQEAAMIPSWTEQ